jgi:hypothetical protein
MPAARGYAPLTDVRLLYRVGLSDADVLRATYRVADPGPVLVQRGAVLATVKDAARRASSRGGLAAILDRSCARTPWGSSGRDEETAPFSRTKKREEVGRLGGQNKGWS